MTSASRRVLMLLENNPYPQDIRVRQEADALVTAGHSVSVISPKTAEQPWREVVDGVRVYRFPTPPEANGVLGYIWEYAYSMGAALVLSVLVYVRHGFDVIHAHSPPDLFVFVAWPYKVLGTRFVFDHHDLSPEMYCACFNGTENRWLYRALVAIEKVSCRTADHVIATNESHKIVEMERGRVPEHRITVVRNGPEEGFADLAPPDRELRATAGTVLAYVGDIGQHDGVDHLVHALRYLAHDLGRTDFHAVIVGAGPSLKAVQALATRLDLDDHIMWTGWVPRCDVVRYVSAADVCVDPDPSNAYNDRCTMIKIAEYMALGKPVVAFDLPEHRATAGEAAVYARPNDEVDLARQIARLMDDPSRRHEMGQTGKERVASRLAWSYQAERLLEAYRALS